MTRSNRDRFGGVLGVVGAALALTAALAWGTASAQAMGSGQSGGTLSNVHPQAVPPSVDAGPPVVSAGPADEAPAPEAEAPAASTPSSQGGAASKLVGVEARTSPEGTVLVLKGDGRIDGASSFTLENPSRLVLDIPGVQNAVTTPRIDVGSAEVARVRVAQHDGKVRVVIDGGSAGSSFAGRRIEPSSDGLVVTLAGSPGAQQAAASAPAPTAAASAAETPTENSQASAAEPTPSAAPAPTVHQVTGVKLDAQADKHRVEIDADATVKYQVMRPDKETIVVSLRNATLAEGAQTKIAPEQPGPVSLVTAFAQPKTKKPEVRVVIKRAAGAKPTVTRDGEALFIDFPAGDAVAAKPPMLVAPEAPASAAAPAADSGAPHKAMAQASQAAAPASMESGNAADILQEGGLVNGKEYTGRRISLDLKEVDINDVLRLIAEVSDLNVIAGDEVTGKVTIRLVDVPWDQALDVILLTRGLGFVRVGTVLRIAPNEQLKNEEEARLQERRSHEKLEDLTVKLQPVNYANVDEVEKMVKKLLTARGVVNVDKRTNTVIIKDIPSVIDESTALIKAIDTQTPQVLIEAKVVEANLNFSRDIGTTWGFGAQPLQDPLTTGSAPQSLGGSDFLLNTTSASNNNVTFANPITNVATGLANVGAFLLDQKLNINFQLQAAETNGEGKVISSPRVVTLDNREAKILQGDSIPFQTFQNGDAQLEFIDAVLSLTVTPHITADKSIIMKVEVTRNAPDDSVKTPTGSPAIAKNEAKTETLVADGQTLVIGGIYTVDKAEQESRVPYLFKVPILGNLFREHQISDTRKELLIFLTPRVVEHAEVAG